MSENTEDKGFKVKDRRKILQEGEEQKKTEKAAPEKEEAPKGAQEPKEQTGKPESPPLPEINFSTFILSLSTSALMHLGEIPNPETNQIDKNLPLAKQTIDLIDMLKKKTEGNREQDEDNLITNLLYDLKLKYVAAIKKG